VPRLRQNIVSGNWVVIAPERSKRPQDFIHSPSPKKAKKKECPFCVGKNSAYQFSIKEAETDHIYVIPNKYPAFVSQDEVTQKEGEYYPSYKSLGAHEVIILKDHNAELGNLEKSVLEEYYYVYQQRIKFYRDNPTIEYSMIIHNFGPESGASIEHPHSQLFASSVLPFLIDREIKNSRKFFEKEKRCLFCWLAEQEKNRQIRVIAENQHFIAFTFWAARFPFEIWILPKKHQPYFEDIDRSERLALAEVFQKVLGKLNKALNNPPYNYFIHSTPPRIEGVGRVEEYYHWHIELTPRVSLFGGYEIGSGVIIDVVSPEKAALFLNGKLEEKSQNKG